MADLLECLAQIRALAETAPRLSRLAHTTTLAGWRTRPAPEAWAPIEVLAHLAEMEVLQTARLLAMISAERPHLQELDAAALARRSRYLERGVEDELQRFRRRREDTLEVLRSCTAAELARVGVHPRRGVMTVADLVADMLAHDTVHVGQIRQRLAAAEPPGARPSE